MSEPSIDALVTRLKATTEQLRTIASQPPRIGLTSADARTGERWDEGQIWAHMSEFPRFWLGEAQNVLSAGNAQLLEFGRGDNSPIRLGGIDSRRGLDKEHLFSGHVEPSIRDIEAFLRSLCIDDLAARGLHVEDGEMTVRHIVAHYVVDHLEEHVEQLESIH